MKLEELKVGDRVKRTPVQTLGEIRPGEEGVVEKVDKHGLDVQWDSGKSFHYSFPSHDSWLELVEPEANVDWSELELE